MLKREIAKAKQLLSKDPLLQLIATLQERFQLQDWEIALRRCSAADVPRSEDGARAAGASITMGRYHKEAAIHLATDYKPEDGEIVSSDEANVAHEMAHLFLWDLMRVVHDSLGWMQPNVKAMTERLLNEQEELICNILAADATGERPKPYWGEQA